MDLPEELFVRSVPGSDELVAFTFPFALEGKAVGDPIVEELEDGDLIIEGMAASFEGLDRQGENFVEGAFQRGIKSFLGGSAALCFHHKHDQVLGKVLDLQELPGGLKMRARVDGAIKNHPTLGAIYSQIKRGTFKNLSVGGFFKRAVVNGRQMISDMDFSEISVTAVPVHTKPSFAVVAGKALESPGDATIVEGDYSGLASVLDALSANLDLLEGKAVKGDYDDLWFLATLIRLEQMTNGLVSGKEASGSMEVNSKADDRVDALATRVKNYLDGVSREAHALAAELGPLPSMPTMSGSY